MMVHQKFPSNSWVTRNIFNMIDPQTLEGFEDTFPWRASYKQFQHQEVHLSSAKKKGQDTCIGHQVLVQFANLVVLPPGAVMSDFLQSQGEGIHTKKNVSLWIKLSEYQYDLYIYILIYIKVSHLENVHNICIHCDPALALHQNNLKRSTCFTMLKRVNR